MDENAAGMHMGGVASSLPSGSECSPSVGRDRELQERPQLSGESSTCSWTSNVTGQKSCCARHKRWRACVEEILVGRNDEYHNNWSKGAIRERLSVCRSINIDSAHRILTFVRRPCSHLPSSRSPRPSWTRRSPLCSGPPTPRVARVRSCPRAGAARSQAHK